MGVKLHFVSINVYNYLGSNGFLLWQETLSFLADKKKWADELKGLIFFRMVKLTLV